MGQRLLNGYGDFFENSENVLELNEGDGRTL